MDLKRFNELRDGLDTLCSGLLGTKGADYTIGSDRLSNFKEVAKATGLTPLQVWAVYYLKHVTAILKFVRAGKLADEGVESRFADARNYLDLGWAIVNENEGD